MKYALFAPIVCFLLAPSLFAAGANHWVHSAEADFKKGKFQGVVATNLGDLKLSRAVKTLLEQDPRISSVYALAEAPDGSIYAATGPQGIILQLKADKVSTYATLEDVNAFSMIVDSTGKLLVGTGGEKGRILRIEAPGAKPVEVFSAEGVQYVWQIRQTPDGNLYAATGPTGQIYEIKPDNSKSILFDSDENNILSLITDNKDTLYAGTDPNGLVFRVNRKTKEVFVLYDAAETEVSALALDAKGNLFAGTAQAGMNEESPVVPVPGNEKAGRPEGEPGANPLPSPPRKDPKPPELPKPNPGEPAPIPKNVEKKPACLADPIPKDQPDLPEPPSGPPSPGRPRPGPMAPSPLGPGPQIPNFPIPGQAEGNAIYKIDPEGFVTEVFRTPGMVLSIVEKDGTLLVGTGGEGLVYQVNPAAEETLVVAKVDPKQIMAILPAKDGRIILGFANVGGLASMSSGFATEGTFTSPVLDSGHVSRFGRMHLVGSLPAGTALTVATRSGNMQEPADNIWSKWSDESPATEYLTIAAPAARFFQYRLTFKSGNASATPVVEEVDVTHQAPNLAPRVNGIKIVGMPEAGPNGAPMPNPAAFLAAAAGGAPPKEPPGGRIRQIAWESADANNDVLEFTLSFRVGAKGPWIQLAEKLKEPQFMWDTKGVPDGRYEIRVNASDAKSNPKGEGKTGTRVSDPITIDNTPPAIGDLKAVKADGKPGTVKVEARIVDRTSIVTGVEYAVDSKDDWQAVKSSDSIFDSPEEAVSFTVEALPAGAHQITLRATDDHGNQAYETVLITIP